MKPFYLLLLIAIANTTSPLHAQEAAAEAVVEELEAEEEKEEGGTLFSWQDERRGEYRGKMSEPLASDRPDFTEASSTVGWGVRQLEMGYTFIHDDAAGTRTDSHSFPEFLYRAGLFADWFELRIGWNYGSVQEQVGGINAVTSGPQDLYLGIKFGLTAQDGFLPEMSLVTQMTVPTGHPAFTSGRVLPGLNWLYGWDINEFLSFGGSTQANLAVDDETSDEYLSFAQALTIGYTFTEKLGAYTEWFMITPAGAESSATEHYFDGGFIYRVSKDLQLDVRAGKGLSIASNDYFVGTGAVVRW